MTFSVGDVSVNLRGSADTFIRAMQAAAAKLNSLPAAADKAGAALGGLAHKFEAAEKAGHKFSALGNAMSHVGGGMIAVGAAGAVLSHSVIDVAKDVEYSLTFAAAISGKTADKFDESYGAMSEATVKFAAQHKFTATQVAETFLDLSRASLTAQQSIAVMPEVLRLATASNTDLAESAKIVVGTLNGFGIKISDLANVTNTMVATITNSNQSLADLAAGFKYLAPMARVAGVSIESASAAMGVLAESGIPAESAGTGLRSVLSKIVQDSGKTNQAGRALKALGISSKLLATEGFRGVVAQGEKVFKTMSAMGKQTQYATLVFDAFGIKGASSFATLAANGVSMFDRIAGAIESAKRTDLASFIEKKQLDTMEGALHRLSAAVQSAGLTLGTALKPAARAVVEALVSMINWFNNLNPNLKSTIGILFGVTMGLTTVVGAIGTVVAALGMVIPSMVAFGTAIGLTEASFSTFALTLGTAVLALGVFAVSYVATRKIMDALGAGTGLETNPFKVMATAIDDATSSLNGFLHVAINALATLMSMGNVVNGIVQTLGNPVAAVQGAMNGKSPMSDMNSQTKDFAAMLHDLIDKYVPAPATKSGKAAADAAKPAVPGTPDFEAMMQEQLSAAEAAKLAAHMRELAMSLRKVGDAADAANLGGIGDDLRPFTQIRVQFGNNANDIREKFGDIMTASQQAFLIVKNNMAKEGAVRDELTKQIDDGTIKSFEQLAAAVNAAGLDVDHFTDVSQHLADVLRNEAADAGAKAADAAQQRASDIANPKDVHDQVYNMLAGGLGMGSSASTDQLIQGNQLALGGADVASAGLSGGLGGAAGAAAGALGAAIGGPIGAQVAQAILSIAEQWATTVGDAIAGVLQTLFSDKRIGEAVGGAQNAAGAVVAGAGLAALAAIVAGALLPFELLIGAVVLLFTVITFGLVLVVLALAGAILIGIAALLLWPVVIGGVFGAFFALAQSTKSYARMQGALSVVIDRVVAAMEPFFANALGMVGLFQAFASVFTAFTSQLANDAGLWGILFEVVKGVGIALVSFGLVVAYVYDGFVKLTAAIVWLATWITTGFDAKKADAAAAAIDQTGISVDALQTALGNLIGLTYEQAKADGESAAATWDAAQATKGLTEGVLNAPMAFRVEKYRFDAQGGREGGAAGGAAGGATGTVINIGGDLKIIAEDTPLNRALDELNQMSQRRKGQNTGNPYHGGGGGGPHGSG